MTVTRLFIILGSVMLAGPALGLGALRSEFFRHLLGASLVPTAVVTVLLVVLTIAFVMRENARDDRSRREMRAHVNRKY